MLKKPARWKRFKRILYRGNTRHVLKIPTMLSGQEIDYLYRAARDRFSNSGYIIDAGCFLGGSTLSLAGGILENVRWKSRPRFPVIHSYDLFKVEPWTIGVYFEKDIPAGSSFLEEYKRLIGHCENLVQIHEGNILAETWDNGEIEILFIDIAKHWKVNDHIVKTFFSSLVPGHSIVIQQDYLYTEWNGWIPVTMEYLADYFSIIDVISGSVIFRYEKRIPEELLKRDVFSSLDTGDIFRLFDRAIARFKPRGQAVLRRSREHLTSVLPLS